MISPAATLRGPRLRLPTIGGVIDRRILANYVIDPEVLARQLPSPFRPKLIRGQAVGGICLIRLSGVRPRGFPRFLGFGSENAAHRFAVEWDLAGETHEGVFVPRRDTSSRMSVCVGGRIFPGEHHHARFEIDETEHRFDVRMRSDDDETEVEVIGEIAARLPEASVFSSLDEASAFFERGSLGYSATKRATEFDGLELAVSTWHVDALRTDHVRSSYFDDRERFPAGSVRFDHALLMRSIEHEWHGRDSLCCG